jgi:ABC-2 type transport system permease protein
MTTVDIKPSLSRLTAVELRKLVDTRAGFWLLTVIGLLTALLVTADLIWEDREILGLRRLLGDAVVVPGLLLPVLGVLLVTSEWSQRTNLVPSPSCRTGAGSWPRRSRLGRWPGRARSS